MHSARPKLHSADAATAREAIMPWTAMVGHHSILHTVYTCQVLGC